MTFLKISKTQKLTPKHPKSQNSKKFKNHETPQNHKLKIKKSCKEASYQKKIRKQTMVRIGKS